MNFKELRRLQKVKQKNISNELNISFGCISQYETGKRQPSIEQLPKLAEMLGCSIEQVVMALIETKNQAQTKY